MKIKKFLEANPHREDDMSFEDILKRQKLERIGFDDIDGEFDDDDDDDDDDIDGVSEYHGEEDEESMYSMDSEDDEWSMDKHLAKEYNLKGMEGEDDEDDILDEEDDEPNEVTIGLTSLIKRMIDSADIEGYYVYTQKDDISVQFVMNKTEKLSYVLRVIALVNRILIDILVDYDTDLDLWKTTTDDPIFTIDFYKSKKKKNLYKDDLPF